MKVHLVRKQTIEAFVVQNAQSRIGFAGWLTRLRYASWEKPADMQHTFPAADLLGNGSHRVVFDIAGNRYRLIAKYAFGQQQMHLFICWIGTHAAYTNLCDAGEQYTVSAY